MKRDFLVERINKLTLFIGPTPSEDLHFTLLKSGLYQRAHTEIRVNAPVGMGRVARMRAAAEK
jgi:hypothetical protein